MTASEELPAGALSERPAPPDEEPLAPLTSATARVTASPLGAGAQSTRMGEPGLGSPPCRRASGSAWGGTARPLALPNSSHRSRRPATTLIAGAAACLIAFTLIAGLAIALTRDEGDGERPTHHLAKTRCVRSKWHSARVRVTRGKAMEGLPRRRTTRAGSVGRNSQRPVDFRTLRRQ